MPAKKTTKTMVTKTRVPKKTSAARKAPAKKAAAAPRRPASKPAPAPRPAPAAATPAPQASARASAASRRVVTPEQRFRMIEEQAYFIAERDGFKGHPDAYWFAAEREVESMLGE